jgi:MFS family permease
VQPANTANGERGFRSSPIFSAAWSVWALLVGIAFLTLGNGLQGTLLGVRAASENFGSTVTGFVMTGYFVGFLLGSTIALKTIRRVGHLRVFAAATCMASLAILVQSLFVDPIVWGVMRIISGFCLASSFIVAESWLNDRVTNQHRGGLLAVYMVITFCGMAGGQLLLLAGSPSNHDLFIVCSALITFAAVPILLSLTPQPVPENAESLSIVKLYSISPLGVVGTFGAGLLQGAIFSMGAVFAHNAGLSTFQTSLFMFSMIAGAALMQWPIGKLSDRIDRRKVITGLALFGAIMPIIGGFMFELGTDMLIISAALIGIGPLLLYSLFIAYTNDYLRPEQFVAAGSGIILIFGTGAVIGPPVTGMVMDAFGSQSFLWFLAAGQALIFAFALYRMTQRESIPVEEQTLFPGAPVRTASLAPAIAEWVQAQSDEDVADAGPSEEQREREVAGT